MESDFGDGDVAFFRGGTWSRGSGTRVAPRGVSHARVATAAFGIRPSALGGGHRHRTVRLVSHFLGLTTTISSLIYISDYSNVLFLSAVKRQISWLC